MEKKKLVLQNRLSPGDILMMSGTIRDLHLAYPNEYLTDVKSPCNEIFDNNPWITKGLKEDKCQLIDMQYPLIHHSGYSGVHFSDGYKVFLQEQLKIVIPKTSMRPEIYLSQSERDWVNPVVAEFGWKKPYWIMNAGCKSDYTLKKYPYYQDVVDRLQGRIKFVQVGIHEHDHPALNNVLDMRGKTNLRQLFRLSYHAEGAVCCVSLQMVIMQAFSKPCVVVAGGREGMRWQALNDHRFLHTIGLLPCCQEDGCWKSKEEDCTDMVNGVPKCMKLIEPQDVAQAVELYYRGGRLDWSLN